MMSSDQIKNSLKNRNHTAFQKMDMMIRINKKMKAAMIRIPI